nr:hypothetical protein CFP56_79193 [Quercus suber]
MFDLLETKIMATSSSGLSLLPRALERATSVLAWSVRAWKISLGKKSEWSSFESSDKRDLQEMYAFENHINLVANEYRKAVVTCTCTEHVKPKSCLRSRCIPVSAYRQKIAYGSTCPTKTTRRSAK